MKKKVFLDENPCLKRIQAFTNPKELNYVAFIKPSARPPKFNHVLETQNYAQWVKYGDIKHRIDDLYRQVSPLTGVPL